MATKLYFHKTASTEPGTLPASNASISATSPSQIGDGTNYTMNRAIGASQQSTAITTSGGAAQPSLLVRFVSDRLASQTFALTSIGDISLGIAGSESNAQSNFQVRLSLATWRPSTGAIVTRIHDLATNATAEPGTAETSLTSTNAAGGTSATVADGDVLIIEIWRDSTVPANATARTNTVFYDGTTEASTSSNAAFINFPNDTLKFAPQSFGQAQAQIKGIGWGFGQARAYLPNSFVAQAQGLIAGSFTYVDDNFNRSVTDDWDTASTSGGVWTLIEGTAANIDVDGSFGTIVSSSNSGVALETVSIGKNLSIKVQLKADVLATTTGDLIYILAQRGSSDSFVKGTGLLLAYDPAGQLALQVYDDTGGSVVTTYVYTPNDLIQIYFQIVPTSNNQYRIRGKIWKVGDVEPAYSTILKSPVYDTLPGHVLLRVVDNDATTITFSFDNLEIVNAAWTESGQAQANIAVQPRVYGQAQAFILKAKGLGQAQAYLTGIFPFSDTFTRSSSDSFGSATVGGTYTIEVGAVADFDVNGTQGTIANADQTHKVGLRGAKYSSNFEFYAEASISANPTSGKFYFLAFPIDQGTPDVDSTSVHNYMEFVLDSTGISGAASINGQIATTSTTAYTVNDTWAIKVRYLTVISAATSQIAIKIWKVGTTEPAYTVANSSSISPSGYFSILVTSAINPAAATWTIDNISVVTAAPQGWGQAQSKINAFAVKGYGQAQAKINTTRVFAQAQSDIKATSNTFGQAQAFIIYTNITLVTDTFTRIVNPGLGTSDSGWTYTLAANSTEYSRVDGANLVIDRGGIHHTSKWYLPQNDSGTFKADFYILNNEINHVDMTYFSRYLGSVIFATWALGQYYLGYSSQTIIVDTSVTGWYRFEIQFVSAGGDVRVRAWRLGDSIPDWQLTDVTSATPFTNINYATNAFAVTIQSGALATEARADNLNQKDISLGFETLTYGQAQADIKQTYPLSPYARTILADSPVSYWRFGERVGSSPIDEMGAHSGTYFGSPTLGVAGALSGDTNTAITLNGTTQYMTTAPNDAGLTINNTFTLEIWFKQSSIGVTRTLFRTVSNLYVYISTTNRITAENGAANFFRSPVDTVTDTTIWHHFVLTKNGSTTVGYLDGVVLSNDQTDATVSVDTDGIAIGARPSGANPFPGSLDEPAIYNYALTPTQVSRHYAVSTLGTYETTIKNSAPIAWWRLGESSGTNAKDEILSHDGTYVNTPTLGVTGAIPGDTNTGITLLAASSEYLTSSALNVGDGPVSYEIWIKRASGTNGFMSLMNGAAQTPGLWFNDTDSVGKLNFGRSEGNSFLVSSIAITDTTTWHHIVATKPPNGSGNAAIYIDGVDRTTVLAGNETTTNAGSLFHIGTYWTLANGFDGSIDEPAVYNYVLTAAQVAAHYAARTMGGNPFGQAQAKIVAAGAATINVFAQAQADIKKTTNVFAQANADIKATSNAYAQAQAKIIPSRVFGQAQADIKATSNAYAQAQAKINTTRVFGQAQADIKATSNAFAQAQADIKVTTNQFAQAQANIKKTTNQFAQAQANIKKTTNQFAQAQANIKKTTNQFAQAQADILAVSRGYGQSQADIKVTTNVFAQAQADIKATVNVFAQAQADIKKVTNAFAQAQADIKATSNVFAQAQADILHTYSAFAQAMACVKGNAFGQAQADIKQTYQAYAQTQADIKATSNAYGQANADIKATSNAFAQANADIKQTTNVFAQTQASIIKTYQIYGQAQADIKATSNAFAQAQADIKSTSNAFAQAQADIKVTTNCFGQAQADIKHTYNAFAQAMACVKGNAYGQAQADIKQTYQAYAQAQADIKATYQGYAQANADILSTITSAHAQAQADILVKGFGFAQANADIKATTNCFAQAQADILHTYQGYGQAQACVKGNAYGQSQADIKATYQAYAQSQADIKATYQSYAQAQADIKAVTNVYSQAQADIKTSYQAYGQSQADIKVTTNQFAQAQTDIKSTSNGYGQCQADIKTTYQAYAQAQADIKQTYNGFGQAQADILHTYQGYGQVQACIVGWGFGQSQADIKQTYQGYGQASCTILGAKQGYACAQADIKATSRGYGQACADIKTTYQAYAQAQADILRTFQSYAQCQASIKSTVQGYGQSNADIKAVGYGFGQCQADIKATSRGYGQCQADIKVTTIVCAQANAQIVTTRQSYGQAQGTIKATVNSCGQANADIKATSNGYGQAQTDIKVTSQNYAQAQGYISTIKTGCGQAQADIKVTSRGYGQAQADILVTTSKCANAQALITTNVIKVAQAQARIKVNINAFGQTQGVITSGTAGYGQAQALIQATANSYGQAQGTIVKSAGYGQAQALIFRTHTLANVEVSDERSINCTLDILVDTTTEIEDAELPDVDLEEENITILLSDERGITLTLDDLAYI